jgi:HPt (histidine-containing phosphotransfer) domain-containing protein
MNTDLANVAAIDMRAITQLAEGDDRGAQFIKEIIDVFLGDLTERVAKIGLLMSEGDRAGVASMAHAIKGSCGHFGATRLADSTREIEHQVKKPQLPDGLQPAIDAMVAETERVRAALEAYRSERAPC